MATVVRGKTDEYVKKIKAALDAFETSHPGAVAELYRQNSGSIRVRIIDQRFAKMSRPRRHDEVWDFLADRLDDDTLQEISVLLPIGPAERDSSFMSMEFDHPVKSDF